MLVLDETPYEEQKDVLQVAPTGIAKASAMAVMKLPVDIAGAGLIVAGGVDELLFGRDNFYKLYDEEIKPIQDKLTPEAGSVSAAGQFISGIVGFVPALALGPMGVPLLAGQSAINTGAGLVEQGVEAKTATGAAILAGASGTAMAGLPQAASTWTGTLALAALNPVIGAASTQAEKSLLQTTGHEDIAKAYDPFDPVARGIDSVLGVAFGAMGKYQKARQEMPTKTKDSIDTIGNWQRMFKDTPFYTTVLKTADLCYKAMEKALSDISQGKPVDLSGVVPDVVPLAHEKTPVRAEAHEAKQAIAAAERAYQMIDAPTPRDIAHEEVGKELAGKLPAEQVKIVGESRNIQNAGMPGFFDQKYYEPYLKKLWEWHKDTEIQVSRADLDIGHVNGMNDTLGHFETDKHLLKISEIIKNTVEAHGIKDATFSRYGGDELAVEAVGVPREILDKSIRDAKIKVDQYARDNGLLGLTAKKKNSDGTIVPITKDVTLHVNTADFSQFKDYEDMRKANDAKRVVVGSTEEGAKQNELRVSTETTGPVTSEGQPAGGARRGAENIGRDSGSVQPAAPAPEVTPSAAPPVSAREKKVLPLSESKRLSLEVVRKYIEHGEAATRRQEDYEDARVRREIPSGRWVRWEPNPFPEYFKGKGFKKKETLAWIDKALAGEPLTPKQHDIVSYLMEEHRSNIARQFINARDEMRGYGHLADDPTVNRVEERLAEQGDFPIHTGTDALGMPTAMSARDFLGEAKAEYKKLESQKDIFSRISDCM